MLILAGSSRQPAVSGNCLFPPTANVPGIRFYPTELQNSAQSCIFEDLFQSSLFTLYVRLMARRTTLVNIIVSCMRDTVGAIGMARDHRFHFSSHA